MYHIVGLLVGFQIRPSLVSYDTSSQFPMTVALHFSFLRTFFFETLHHVRFRFIHLFMYYYSPRLYEAYTGPFVHSMSFSNDHSFYNHASQI
jgi:hypothetical protein